MIQNKQDEILIKIAPDNWLEKKKIDTEKIRNIVKNKGLKVKLKFVQSEDFEYTKAGKYKFIINNIKVISNNEK